jgi:site-specific recombinase XerD
VSPTDQHRAIVEALRLAPDDLRRLAEVIESHESATPVREIVQAELAERPRHHRYVKPLRRLAEWAGDRNAADVPPEDIARWARRAGDEARDVARARHGVGAEEAFVLAARAAYRRAVASGAVRVNPAERVDLPERPASRRTALTSDQLKQAHLCLIAHSRDPELDDLVFQLLRETACRRGGASSLSRAGLAPATGMVRLIEKYGKDRWVPVSAHLMGRLVSHRPPCRAGCERLLHRQDGGHLTSKWFEGFAHRIQQAAWSAELEVSAHWLRHTTLTDIERIAGVRVAAAYAGHSDRRFGATGIYTKASPEELQAAHARLFFDDPADAANARMRPLLFRRPLPAMTHTVLFTSEQ